MRHIEDGVKFDERLAGFLAKNIQLPAMLRLVGHEAGNPNFMAVFERRKWVNFIDLTTVIGSCFPKFHRACVCVGRRVREDTHDVEMEQLLQGFEIFEGFGKMIGRV